MIKNKDYRLVSRNILKTGDFDASEVDSQSKSENCANNSPEHVGSVAVRGTSPTVREGSVIVAG